MTERDAGRSRRRAALLLGAVAIALVLAGLLPWLGGATTAVRVIALPMLLAGVLVTGAAVRMAAVRPATPVVPVERTCDGCACGAGGCASLRADAR